MAKKKTEIKAPREMTKRQMTRWQQAKLRQLIAFIGGIVIIVAVIGVLGTGWYLERYKPMREVILKVNGTEFNLNYYTDMLKYYGRSQPQYISYLADQVLTLIEQSELVKQGAYKLGISISDEDLAEELVSRKLGPEYSDPIRTTLLTEALKTTYFDGLVPEFGEQRQTSAMLLEDASQVAEVKARLEKGESFSDLAGQLSLDNITKTNKGDLGSVPKGVIPLKLATTALEDKVFAAPLGELQQASDADVNKKVGYLIVRMFDRDLTGEKRAHILAILLGAKEDAQKVKARLNAGEEFATVAKEVSLFSGAKENGGDEGWISPGMWGKEVDDFVFGTNTKEFDTSEPIRDETQSTKGGYWLFNVQSAENKKIEGENRDTLVNKLFEDWVRSLTTDPNNKIERLITPAQKQLAIMQATPATQG